MKKTQQLLIVALALTATACTGGYSRHKVSLEGKWQTELGPVQLPGTTDEAGIGDTISNLSEDTRLSRSHSLISDLTYTGDIIIPATMDRKHIELFIERTKPTTLWVDGDSIGHQTQLLTPHVYDLSNYRAGRHTIKLKIDNRTDDKGGDILAAIGGSHAITEATQTNWNGAVGEIALRSMAKTFINHVTVTPTIDSIGINDEGTRLGWGNVKIDIEIESSHEAKATIDAKCLPYPISTGDAIRQTATTIQVTLKRGKNKTTLAIPMEEVELWSEFQQPLYVVDLTLDSQDGVDKKQERLGFRTFETQGRQFVVNGQPTILRGKHDACVFPLTGYAPMDKESWIKVFKTAKEYGINHYRFHSWTPPAAAFDAADEVGIYLQPELPYWGELKPSNTSEASLKLNNYLYDEGLRIVREYGNHPSFVMMALGNELSGDTVVMRQMVDGLRKADPRHLYAFGSNNFLGWMGDLKGEDFHVTCRMGWAPTPLEGHTRASFSLADADEFGILNGTKPNTRMNFAAANGKSSVPVVGHETCQYQIYPDYAEIAKYNGVLKPLNLINFRAALRPNHLDSLAVPFHKASGAFAVKLYKADIEMNLRTPDYGGFQLLDLQDYPGQGGALVGILDPFMESKGLITPDEWRSFCSPIVPLALMDKLTFSTSEKLNADVAVANYSQNDIMGDTLRWTLCQADDTVAEGCFKASAAQGNVHNVGKIVADLSKIDKPSALKLTLALGDNMNSYDVWVYPTLPTAKKTTVIRASRLTDALLKAVENGATCLLTPDHKSVSHQTVGGMFITDYWNYAMFKSISENNGKEVSPGTLGYLIDDKCPLFKTFPTENHSDFQWWAISRATRPLILDGTPATLRPTVMAIDNVNRNHKLGVIFGVKVGKGKVLVCMTDFSKISNTIEGKQFIRSIEEYAASEDFVPTFSMTALELKHLLTREIAENKIVGVKNISDYKELK